MPGCKHYILALQRPESADEAKYMSIRTAVYRIQRPGTGPGRQSHMADITEVYRPVTRQEVKAGWERQFRQSLTVCMHGPNCKHGAACELGKRMRTMHIIGGSLLPIWSKVEKVLHANSTKKTPLKITRVRTEDGKRIVGVGVPSEAVVQKIIRAIEDKDDGTGAGLVPPPSVPAYGMGGGSAGGSTGASFAASLEQMRAAVRDVKPADVKPAVQSGAYASVSASVLNAATGRADGAASSQARKQAGKQPAAFIDLSGDD